MIEIMKFYIKNKVFSGIFQSLSHLFKLLRMNIYQEC